MAYPSTDLNSSRWIYLATNPDKRAMRAFPRFFKATLPQYRASAGFDPCPPGNMLIERGLPAGRIDGGDAKTGIEVGEMANVILTPIIFVLGGGLVATLGVVYAALVISARTEAVVSETSAEDGITFANPAVPASDNGGRLPVGPPGRARHAPV